MPPIRKATVADCAALTDLALTARAFWGYSGEKMRRLTPTLTVTEQMITNWESGVLEQAGGIAGFFLLDCHSDPAELIMLYVDPLAMGKGYGRRLFTDAAALARRRGRSHLDIIIDPNASGFYKRMGARQVGWRFAYPSDADELPLYRLKL